MALIVEDGTGLENADSYRPLSDAIAYATAFGRPDFLTLDADAQEVKMRQSAQFIDLIYQWPGRAKSATQALAFPRDCVYIDGTLVEGVPSIVGKAQIELATLPGVDSLVPDMEVSKVVFRSVKIDTLEKREQYRNSVVPRHYWIAEAILRPLLQGSLIGGMRFNRIVRC